MCAQSVGFLAAFETSKFSPDGVREFRGETEAKVSGGSRLGNDTQINPLLLS